MTRLTLQLELPEDLARDADERGLLTPAAIEQLLRKELGDRPAGRLAEMMNRLHAVTEPPLTEQELEAEIHAYRAEKRAGNAGRS